MVLPFKRICLECGEPFEARSREAEFCSRQHRNDFGNRRLQRGAEIYDLWMALRFDRETATALKAWKLLCRLAAVFREEDVIRRGGRRSWQSPRAVLERRPWLYADVLSKNAAGARRR